MYHFSHVVLILQKKKKRVGGETFFDGLIGAFHQ
jgi:hypothetical protein